MSQPEVSDTQFSRWNERGTSADDESEIIRLSAARSRAMEEAGAEIARQLNGPLTALLLYMGEIKQNSQQLAQAAGNRLYLQQVVENALAQTERVCALIKQMADPQEGLARTPCRKAASRGRIGHAGEIRTPGKMFSSEAGQKPLTKREREVFDLISQGFSNKQGAQRMDISPRTFESHRAEAMRKLGARNTADLVRLALLHSAV
jgi:DNA-binding CsgD family transcriptional regulator